MTDRLGILVNTDRHPDYVRELAQAACRHRKQVYVHFSGDGLALVEHPSLAGLERTAVVTASVASRQNGAENCPAGPGMDLLDLSRFFSRCDRWVVL